MGGYPASGQCGTYLCDFLWHLWVDVQPVVSVVHTSRISLACVGGSLACGQCGTHLHDFFGMWGGCPVHGQCGTYFHDFIGHVGGRPTHGQRGTYLHDFLWHVWVDVQHVVSVVPTSMISLAYGWMSRAWSMWYLAP